MSESTTTPQHLGRYELVTKLATGGMAELFLARERGIAGLERLVVIKQILPHLADDPSFIDMFLREARIVARLNHPNVVQIYELGEENGSFYIAMEYIHGSTVREMQVLAEREGVDFPLGVIVSILDQSCRGLHAAHQLRDLEGNAIELIHRDVSPHNLMCTTEGYVKVLDFGVAKAAEGAEATNSGRLKGKFAYMSPEQCLGHKLDRRADIFSLGVVLWESLTGRRLFKREKDLDMMRAVVNEPAEAPSNYNSAVPEALDRVVLKALSKDRDKRFQTADEMRLALLDAARSSGIVFGEDRLAKFLGTIAGEELSERRQTMQDALERSLTSNERRNLLHVTGSGSHSAAGGTPSSDHLPTVVERPNDSGSFSGVSRRGSASQSMPGEPRAFNEPTGSVRSGREGSSTHSGASGVQSGHLQPAPPSDEPAEPGSGRNNLLFSVGGVLLVALIAATVAFLPQIKQSPLGQKVFGSSSESPILIGDPLRIGWAPIATREVLSEEIKPLKDYLEAELGRPVQMEVTDSYAALSDGLQTGTYDVGVVPPLLYVRTKRAAPDIDLLAVRQFAGATSSDALLLTMMDGNISSLEDLEGKTFCFTDKNSTTGNFLPRAYLRKQGHDPETFIGEVVWSGNHLQVLRDLIAGKCQAAATYSGSFLTAEKFDVPVGRIRQLAITGHVPQDSVVAAPGTAESIRSQLQKALFDFEPSEDIGQPKVGEILQITGFSEASDDDFTDLREAVEQSKPAEPKADTAGGAEAKKEE